MKRLLVCATFALAIVSCNNGGDSGSQGGDTLSPASGATGIGPDNATSGDTTGLNVGAAQAIDSTRNARPMNDEPGSNKSAVTGNGTTTGGSDSAAGFGGGGNGGQ